MTITNIIALVVIGIIAVSIVGGFIKYQKYSKGKYTRLFLFGKLVKEWNQPVEDIPISEEGIFVTEGVFMKRVGTYSYNFYNTNVKEKPVNIDIKRYSAKTINKLIEENQLRVASSNPFRFEDMSPLYSQEVLAIMLYFRKVT